MNILVTGGTGTVGRAAVARLVDHGHKVRVIGRRQGLTIPSAEYCSCDINDFASLRPLMGDIEGVVHLAAIIHPCRAPGHEIFRVNGSGTFNVFQAAADAGIKRVVTASSINAFGYNFGIVNFDLNYFPIDEEHPACTTDAYSFSKQIMEETAAYFWRREGISSICLRLPAVYEITPDGAGLLGEFVRRSRRDHIALMALAEPERQVRVQELIDSFEQLRLDRAWEKPMVNFGMDLPDRPLMFGRSNFWTSIDSRDSAQAIEQGLLVDYTGSHALFINDSQNFTPIDSEELLQTFFPEVVTRKTPLHGLDSVVSIDKARTLIGFEPQYSVTEWCTDGTPDL